MCGRFVSSSSPQQIAEHFAAAYSGEPLPESYNVAPTDDVYGVITGRDGQRRVAVFHWGLVPVWAKDAKVGSKMINARAETVATNGAFKPLMRTHRCIVPMDGFYEWTAADPGAAVTTAKRGKPPKQPIYVTRRDGRPLAVAGLWTTWRDRTAGPDAPWLHSCTVVTTAANATMSTIHDRMPVVLPQRAWDEWLDPANTDVESLAALLGPPPDGLLTMRAVGSDVNNVRNNGPELIASTAG